MNNDLISREALKNDFDCVGFNDYDDYNRALRIIDNAATVPLPDFKDGYRQAINDGKTNFSRPTGEWIESCKISSSEYFRNKENFIESKCSNCNRWSLRLDFQIEEEFCPNCGAKMK